MKRFGESIFPKGSERALSMLSTFISVFVFVVVFVVCA